MANLLAEVDRYERGWLWLDRTPDVRPGDDVWLAFMGRPICSAVVAQVNGTRIKTDFNLFFAVRGDDLLASAPQVKDG